MKNILLIVCLLAGLGMQSQAQSDKDGWVLLTEKLVAYKAETDHVNMLGKKQNLSKIKLKCVQGTVKLKQIRVEMSDGTKKEYSPKGTGVFSKGMSSFAFELPGNDTKLKELAVEYDSVGNIALTKRAKVEIWGKERKGKED
ncbi:DUF2541 domain-containing protein [Mangrovibacterium lignilyticum]|uniref:DUF2541 domain-containing protein n=1 Tax=Mangrovibacterium lignilyticum TaxID=2668052 RepID=UPI0013D51062|nr:DUF2541 domain-containing protein [Mangrovibacterium lignilyticum]